MHVLAIVLSLILATSATALDLIEIEGEKYGTGYLPSPKEQKKIYRRVSTTMEIPDSYDAREFGLVTPIKNQGSCGSCWSFARTRAFEAALILAGKPDTLDLAEQDALVNDKNSYGCSGGFMDGRFEVNEGVTTEALCPYRGRRVACRGEKYAKALRWAMIGEEGRAPTEDELKAAIFEYGVLAVTVAATNSFNTGRDGRITRCGGRRLNHMVNLAGYRPSPDGRGTEFLVVNSWGEQWGDKGFAWSKQGCNRLASVPGDAALFFYYE